MDERHDVLKRITADPAIFGGKPIIRGMRIGAAMPDEVEGDCG